MLFTGFSKRNIYPQSDLFNFLIEGQIDNWTGISRFGFSGNQGNIEFLLSSGQIYNSVPSNTFLSSYSPNNIFQISGNVRSNSYDIYINDSPYCLGISKTTGYYNYLYVNSENVTTDLSFRISGDAPAYSYDPFESYFSGQIIPLTLTNSGEYPFKIFSGTILNNSNFSLSNVNNVDVTGTKVLNVIANNFTATQQQIPVSLYTNFGNIILNFTAAGTPIDSGSFYLFFGPENNTIVSDIPNSYIVTVKSFTGVNLITKLEYISGITGNYYKDILRTNLYTGNASGIITGSGNLTSLQTGTIREFNSLLGDYESGTGTGFLTKFIVSTGDVSGEFEVQLSGKGSGLLEFDAPITGTGQFLFEGTIGPNGGFLTATGLSGSGSGFNEFGIYYGFTTSGIGTVFVPYTGDSSITGIFNSSQYELANYVSDLFFYTGLVEKFYLISGLAWATGGIITGQLLGEFGYNFEPGTYTFIKGFTGVGSGFSAIIDSFDPVQYSYSITGTSGLISGIYSTGLIARGCSFEEPYFIPTGVPSQIYNVDGEVVDPLNIFVLTPLNTGEYSGDNINNSFSRTDISRRGNTPSGTGYFNQVFQQPFYADGTWTETLSGYTGQEITNNKGIIKTISANPLLYNGIISGKFKVSGDYTGYQTFEWNGRVDGNFNNYTTLISGITDSSIYKIYPNSYNFDMLLRTGTYAFFLYPTQASSTLSPTIFFPNNITVFSTDNLVKIPFQLSVNSTDTVTIDLEYIDGTARNGANYIASGDTISFPGGAAGTQYLSIPLINSGANSNSFFGVKINNIEGGYISNRNDLVGDNIRIDINSPNINEPNLCCGNTIPTGTTGEYQITLCNNLLGNQGWSNGNGVYTDTTNLLYPVPINYSLVFRLYFSGVNDRVILKAYSTEGPPITFFDNINDIEIDTPYVYNMGVSLPSKTYAIYSEVQGGYLNIVEPRENWNLQLTCDIDSNGNSYELPSACKKINYLLATSSGNISMGFNIQGLSDAVDTMYPFLGCQGNPGTNYLTWEGTGANINGTGEVLVFWLDGGFASNPLATYTIINLDNIKKYYPFVENYVANFYKYSIGNGPSNYGYLTIEGYLGGQTGFYGFPASNAVAYISGGELVSQSHYQLPQPNIFRDNCPTNSLASPNTRQRIFARSNISNVSLSILSITNPSWSSDI